MSAAVLTPPPTAKAPVPQVRFTVEEFDRMGDMGWFEGRRTLLIDGLVREQGPMNPSHAIATGLVQAALQALCGTGWWVRCQLPLHIDSFNNPLPDFAVVPGSPRDYAGRHPVTAALVVEVSDTTLAFDSVEKAERYAEAGIADYWIVDLVNNRLLVFRDPSGTDYLQKPTFIPSDRVEPLAAPGQTVLVSELLP